MNRLEYLGVGLLTLGLAVPVWSQEGGRDEPDLRPLVDRMVRQFDRDGDGKLIGPERDMAIRVAEQFLARMRERGERDAGDKGTAENAREERMKKGPPGGFNLENPPEFVLRRFDKDRDGKLNDEERREARGAMANMAPGGGAFPNREEMRKRFDKDGDGKLSDSEQAAAREEFAKRFGGPSGFPSREEIVRRFDKDGDGRLNATEEAAARAEMDKRRGAGGPAGGLLPGAGKPQEPKLDKEDLLKKFDKDGDGKLSDEEKAAAREAFQKRDLP